MPPRHANKNAATFVMVDVPRAGDAIGGALRGAYGRDRSLPADMLELLAAIDRRQLHHG